ncbi:MAG: Xaa-Pro peptidase family protein [Patescibacteria group bacterium]|nr:Xaa-Pro peptidase family protein [Patescibacteria group bacterium]
MISLDIYRSRHRKIREHLEKRGVEAVLITSAANIAYVTGFHGLSPHEREAVAMVTHRDVFLFLPAMYQEQGNRINTVRDGIVTCLVDQERDGLLTMFRSRVPESAALIFEEDNLSVAEYRLLSSYKEHRWKPAGRLFSSMRMKKDAGERKILKDVVARTDAVFTGLVAYLAKEGYEGKTECDIVELLRKLGRDQELTTFSFDPIVAAGTGSSEPHYRTGLTKLEAGMPLLIDFGFTKNGYHSDLTRTIFLGTTTPEFRKHYRVVLECNKRAIQSCRAGGISAGELHSRAVDFFAKEGLSEYFIHGLGHGVGLEIHEEPFFRKTRPVLLESGMAVTIEPGIYFPGKYGIRIEDFVLLTDTGAEVLSHSSNKELIEIP